MSRPAVSFVTFVSVVAPTADRAEGFSTGHVTYDWNNHLYYANPAGREACPTALGN